MKKFTPITEKISRQVKSNNSKLRNPGRALNKQFTAIFMPLLNFMIRKTRVNLHNLNILTEVPFSVSCKFSFVNRVERVIMEPTTEQKSIKLSVLRKKLSFPLNKNPFQMTFTIISTEKITVVMISM